MDLYIEYLEFLNATPAQEIAPNRHTAEILDEEDEALDRRMTADCPRDYSISEQELWRRGQ